MIPAKPSAPQKKQPPAPNKPVVKTPTVYTLGPGALSVRSEHVVGEHAGKPIVVALDGKDITVYQLDGSKISVARAASSSPALATAPDGRTLVCWVEGSAIKAAVSTDLKAWSVFTAGTRTQQGGSFPCPCYVPSTDGWAIAWVDVPQANTSTGAMDGIGPLYVSQAKKDGSVWTTKKIVDTAAIASCAGEHVVWRDDRAAPGGKMDSIRRAALDGSGEEVLVVEGYDPAYAEMGGAWAVGYHLGSAAYLLYDQGQGNQTVQLDDIGKFVAPAIDADTVAAVWADYPTAEAAKDARNDATRGTGAWVDGAEVVIENGAYGVVGGNCAIVAGVPAIVYTVNGTIKVRW